MLGELVQYPDNRIILIENGGNECGLLWYSYRTIRETCEPNLVVNSGAFRIIFTHVSHATGCQSPFSVPLNIRLELILW